MSTKKATKRALLTSILAICLCLVMLIGSTFAWFTDTASTGVNKIQSGTLDVQLLDKDDVSLEGKTLTWQKADGVTESVLWEPGCTYLTQGFKIKNAGNLALNYKVTVTGVSGNTGLLEVIKFDLVKNTDKNAPGEDLTTFKGTLEAGKVAPTEENTLYYIRGHMDENAGNKYQNMTLDGIAITVNATQAPVESDSYNNQYDANADMTPDNLDQMVTVNVTETVAENGADTVLTEEGKAIVTVPADAVAEGTKELTLSIIPKTNNESNIEITDGQTFQAYDISVSGISSENTAKIPVSFFVGKGLTGVKVYHKGTLLTEADDNFNYNSDSGMVNFEVTSFSPFTVVYDVPTAMIGTAGYETLAAAVAAAKDGETVRLMKSTEGAGLQLVASDAKNITIDFCGNTYTVSTLVGSSGSENQAAHFEKGNTVTMKNGTLEVADSVASSAKILIQNYCNLNVSGMTLDGTNLLVKGQEPYTLSNNDGVVNFENCTVIAADRSDAVAVDAAIWAEYNGADVTLKNCTVYGKLEVAKYVYDKTLKLWVKAEEVATVNEKPCLTVIGGAFTDYDTACKVAVDPRAVKNLNN